MRRHLAWTMAWAAVAGLAVPEARPAVAQAPLVTVDECRNISDAEVRDRIRDLASTSLKTELAGIDYPALVNVYWAKTNVANRIDREVDDAILSAKGDSSWIDRAYSTVSPASATRFATAVADKTYNAEGFKAALDDLATGVAKDAGAQIEKATGKVSNPVLACVQTALQSRYGGAIAQIFVQESQKNLENGNEAAQIKIETGDLVVNNAASISGIVLIVTRRVIAKIVQSVGRRIAGVVASRIVSSVAGLVGIALIAHDLYVAGDGVFPIIEERMKSDETKALIKDEIGKSIRADISGQADAIAQEAADRIYAVWLDFKQKYNRLLALSEKSPAFGSFLKDRRFDQLSRLGQIVDIVYGTEGEDKLLARVADGSLNKALLDLDDNGLTIAGDLKSIDKALQWSATAGRDLARVVENGLFRVMAPDALTPERLQKLLALNDKAVIGRIAGLEPQSRDFVLGLPVERMRDFSRRLDDKQLAAFADYERRLEPGAARRLLRAVNEDPRAMKALSAPSLQRAVLDSKDQLRALDMILNDGGGLIGYADILKDAELVRDGVVGARVFWERYWIAVLGGAFLALMVLSWLRRLLFGRPQVVIRENQPRRY